LIVLNEKGYILPINTKKYIIKHNHKSNTNRVSRVVIKPLEDIAYFLS